MDSCARIKKLIPLCGAGELSAKERVMVEEHLNQCPACQKELDSYNSLRDTLASAKAPEQTPQFWREYEDEIITKIQRTRQLSFGMPLLVRAAAVFVIGLGLGYAGYQALREEPPVQPPSATMTAELPEETDSARQSPDEIMGMKVQPVSHALSNHLHLPPNQGVVIRDFFNHSPFKQGGLRPADIILEVNGQRVVNPKMFSTNILSSKQRQLRFKIIRGGQTRHLVIKIHTKGGEKK